MEDDEDSLERVSSMKDEESEISWKTKIEKIREQSQEKKKP
jgi:hypothetical protein